MRYIDIKDIVVDTTNSLDLVVAEIVQDIMGTTEWHLPTITHELSLAGLEHPRISCTTHTKMVSSPKRSDGYYVCSVLVDNVPAFVFIWMDKGHYDTFILDMECTGTFLRLIITASVERLTLHPWNVHVPHIAEHEDIPSLDTYQGIHIHYPRPSPPALEYEYY